MQIYHPNIQAIQQQTMQLDHASCVHCKKSQQLISHGFVRKKRTGGEPESVGKRVFCSNRNNRTGCGRTMQLYIDSILRYLHRSGHVIVEFVLALNAGQTIQNAYHRATGCEVPARQAYRWLHRLAMQMSYYRSLFHQPPLDDKPNMTLNRPVRLITLHSTFTLLIQQFGQPLCSAYQWQLQRSFL
jgi:hypothetical protein